MYGRYLKEPTNEQIHDFILSQFVTLWETYDSARGSIPKGNLVKAPRLTQLAAQITVPTAH